MPASDTVHVPTHGFASREVVSICLRDVHKTYLEEPVEVYPFGIEGTGEVVDGILDRIVFRHAVDEPATGIS